MTDLVSAEAIRRRTVELEEAEAEGPAVWAIEDPEERERAKAEHGRKVELAEHLLKLENRNIEGPETLRDYFAGQALAGIMASRRWNPAETDAGLRPEDRYDVACECYEVADAFLMWRADTEL